MMIFLSYASEQREVAQEIKLAFASQAITSSLIAIAFQSETNITCEYVKRSKTVKVRISHQPSVGRARLLRAHRTEVCAGEMPRRRGKILPVMIETTDYRHIPLTRRSAFFSPRATLRRKAAEIHKWAGGNGNIVWVMSSALSQCFSTPQIHPIDRAQH